MREHNLNLSLALQITLVTLDQLFVGVGLFMACNDTDETAEFIDFVIKPE